MATTGEETGLIGSDYLAEHPIVPLERIAAAISVDGLTGAVPKAVTRGRRSPAYLEFIE